MYLPFSFESHAIYSSTKASPKIYVKILHCFSYRKLLQTTRYQLDTFDIIYVNLKFLEVLFLFFFFGPFAHCTFHIAYYRVDLKLFDCIFHCNAILFFICIFILQMWACIGLGIHIFFFFFFGSRNLQNADEIYIKFHPPLCSLSVHILCTFACICIVYFKTEFCTQIYLINEWKINQRDTHTHTHTKRNAEMSPSKIRSEK